MPKQKTQKERVLFMLRSAGSQGLRSDAFLEARIPRAAARIDELRREGYAIQSERERQFVRYRLAGTSTASASTSTKGADGVVGTGGVGSSGLFDLDSYRKRRRSSAFTDPENAA